MVDRVAHLPGYGQVAVTSEVVDTLRLLKFGDGLLGWEGDPDMELMVDFESGDFDVWTLDAHRVPYIVLSRPYCDARLVRDVILADTRRRNVVEENLAHNKAQAAAADAAQADRLDEAADKLHFALRKDEGRHVGGLSKRLHAVTDRHGPGP